MICSSVNLTSSSSVSFLEVGLYPILEELAGLRSLRQFRSSSWRGL